MSATGFGFLIVLAIAITFFVWNGFQGQEMKSFWDFVRNPSALPNPSEIHHKLDETAAELRGSPEAIAKIVDRYVFEVARSSDGWGELQLLRRLGKEAHPRALAILRDPVLKGRLVQLKEDENSLPEAPLNRLCEILDEADVPPQEAAPLLSPYLNHESDKIRKSVARTIASIGSVETYPDIQRSLKDRDEYVRSDTLRGIRSAIRSGRIDRTSRDELFDIVASLWPGDTSYEVSDDIPVILLELDRERAVKLLLSEELFTVRFSRVAEILQALKEQSVPTPRDRLLKIIEDADRLPQDYSVHRLLGEALPLLAEHRDPHDLALLERNLDHEDEWVTRGAIDALTRYHQFKEQLRDPWTVIEEKGWDGLTTTEKHLFAVERLDAEVNNGGFAQYFFNSAGDHWQDAMDGLAAIGASKHWELLQASTNKFRDSQPENDREKWMDQLAKVTRKTEDPFQEQDDAWYQIEDENLERLAFKHKIQNLSRREQSP